MFFFYKIITQRIWFKSYLKKTSLLIIIDIIIVSVLLLDKLQYGFFEITEKI